MEYELCCQNNTTGAVYDITQLARGVTHSTYIDGQPGTLMFTLEKDPDGELQIANGHIITFKVDGEGVFYGYVFTMGTRETGEYEITAYDQMRYLKNQDVYATENMTASGIFEMVCRDHFNTSRWEVVAPSTHVPPEHLHVSMAG